MKQIWGLVIADPNEIHDSKLKFIKQTKVGGTIFLHYEWNNVEIIIVQSGIGIVNAAMMTQKIIDLFYVNKILNYGAVGGTDRVKLFDTIIPDSFYFHDVETPWYPRSQTPGEKELYKNAFLKNDGINIASGNSFVHKPEHLESIRNDLQVDLFDMESSAIAQVCFKNEIKFFCVKGISDIINITKSEKQDINSNISKASKNALNVLISLFDVIKSK
ncbi:MAG: hypothetical protein KFW07_01255 [Mycoplasmataceae bacterium]|nr:hypothetical protein [Mycoplasmataceae bacterium]